MPGELPNERAAAEGVPESEESNEETIEPAGDDYVADEDASSGAHPLTAQAQSATDFGHQWLVLTVGSTPLLFLVADAAVPDLFVLRTVLVSLVLASLFAVGAVWRFGDRLVEPVWRGMLVAVTVVLLVATAMRLLEAFNPETMRTVQVAAALVGAAIAARAGYVSVQTASRRRQGT